MKKVFKYYLLVWAILVALFNVIAFVSVGWTGQAKYTPSFWIGYAAITVAFVGQLICGYFALKDDNAKKVFYNIPLLTASYIGLIASFVVGSLCMLISPLPYWVGIILCAIVLALNAIAVIKAVAAAELIGAADEKVQTQTVFIKSLTVDADSLIARAQTDEAKAACKKVYEAVRYSDPMSNAALAPIEGEISAKFAEFAQAIKTNAADVTALAEEVVLLVGDRNKKCKLLK